jgi:hypothetical protein
VFVAIGVATHDASATAFARDALCFLGAWFAVALTAQLYTRFAWWRLAATWLVGVSVGVLVRAAIVGHVAVDFWGIALAFIALFVLSGRLIAARLR